MNLVRVLSCVKGSGLNSGRYIVTYEFISQIGVTGSKACYMSYAVDSVYSLDMLR